MMKKELNYFKIGASYGGNQDWFSDFMMKIGGCAALTACDSCIYLDLFGGMPGLYPFDREHLTKKDYIRFGMLMKPYLRPRWSGVDRLEIYIDGLLTYLSDRGCRSIGLDPFYGSSPFSDTEKAVKRQIDRGFPIPCLLLNHKRRSLKDYEWHWFLLIGYDISGQRWMVKAATYGGWQWLNLAEMWDTGYERRGGLILYETL